jgi:N-acyl-D-amino-acid deacylase
MNTMPLNLKPPAPCDLLIRGGRVIDGSGGEAFPADIAVLDGRIVAVGTLDGWLASETIDASNLAVAPGFIDVHTHDDHAVLDDPGMAAKVTQGVTTVITGLCGLSLAPSPPVTLQVLPEPFGLLGPRNVYAFPTVQNYVERLERMPPSVNVAMLVGHASLRALVMDRFDRAATAIELQLMELALVEALDAGVMGISSGLAYEAGRHAPADELIALARIVGRYSGLYVTHMRDEGNKVTEALDEALKIGRIAECGVIISHHKCLFRANWGRSFETLASIDRARQQQDVALDVYPYTASSTVLTLDRVRKAESVIIAWSDTHPELSGHDLDTVAKDWGIDREATAQRLLPGGGVYFNMDENDLKRIMAHPCCMIGSDGVPGHQHPHPRLWGTFPRVLGHYVRDQQIMDLEQAVHRMTGIPARTFGLKGRGTIAIGAVADIVVFDPATVMDAATYAEPKRSAIGIPHVFVAGQAVVSHGVAQHRPVGKVLRRGHANAAAFAPAKRGGSHHAS